MIRDIESVQSLQLMPYNADPQITAGWKPSKISVLLGAEGSIQNVTRSLNSYVYEDKQIDPETEITGETLGGVKVNLSNIILTADVVATNDSGSYGNSYRVSSVANKTIAMTVPSGANVKFKVTVSNSRDGFTAKAEQLSGVQDISEQITLTENGFVLTVPENTTGQEQSYRVTVSSKENGNIAVVVEVTVTSKPVSEPAEPVEPTEPTEPAEPTEPSAAPTEPETNPTTEPAA
jgi:hypothetical protein